MVLAKKVTIGATKFGSVLGVLDLKYAYQANDIIKSQPADLPFIKLNGKLLGLSKEVNIQQFFDGEEIAILRRLRNLSS